jgi:type I restriction enzyme S subunit
MIGWKEYRVKDIARQMGSGTTPSSKVERYYDSEDYHWINSGDFNDSDVYGGKQMISELAVIESSALRFYMPDTVLVAMYGASIGKVGMLKVKATVNQACCAIVPNTKIVLPYFLFYLFINSKDALISKSFGGTQPNVSQGLIANMIFRIPSLSVQQKIVDYLDEKTSAIDTRVELLEKKKDAYTRLKKAMINRAVTRGLDEHVKLKDSGVEWIGMIPEHWEVKRVKDVCNVVCGATPKDNASYWDGNIIWISPADMPEFGELTEGARTITEQGYQSCGTSLVPAGSIVMSTRAPIGKTNIAVNELCTNQGCKCLTSKKLKMKFMLYCIASKKEQFQALGRGTAFIELSTKDLSLFLFAVPPIPEQQAIAAYLDEKCTKIDAAIANIDKQTDALKRLKRSLINEVISGKRMIEYDSSLP